MVTRLIRLKNIFEDSPGFLLLYAAERTGVACSMWRRTTIARKKGTREAFNLLCLFLLLAPTSVDSRLANSRLLFDRQETGPARTQAQTIPCPPASTSEPSVSTTPATLKLSSFYQKYINADGIPIVSSEKVCDRALQVAYEIVTEELSGPTGPAIRKNLIHSKLRVAIFSNVNGEKLTDLPEEVRYAGEPDFPVSRCGGGAVKDVPVTTVCDGDLLGAWWASLGPREARFDNYQRRESVLVHEFGHTIQNLGLDSHTKQLIEAAYRNARKQNLFPNSKGTPSYMMTNSSEFFAECTLIWFNAVDSTNPVNAPSIGERRQLQRVLPEMYGILSTIYPSDDWHWPNK
ncbi:MAG TPA: hypothetical protein VIH72_09205 [Candidatus Acidoferrales bacterium]